MKVKNSGIIRVILSTVIVCAGALFGKTEGGVLFLSHYNEKLDADYSASSKAGAEFSGVKITSGGKGYPFKDSQPSGEAVDIGYSEKIDPATTKILYSAENMDIRQGTVEMFVKTNWDWVYRDGKQGGVYSFFYLGLDAGSLHSRDYARIHLFFNGTQKEEDHGLVQFAINDGTGDYITNFSVGVKRDADKKAHPFKRQKDTWHYLVISWTSSWIAIFADGKLMAERTLEKPLNIPPAAGKIHIGCGGWTKETNFPAYALIDEVRISNIPLTGIKEIPMREKELATKLTHKEWIVERGISEEPGEVIASGGAEVKRLEKPRRYNAYRIEKSPLLDGKVDDTIWLKIPAITGFTSNDTRQEFFANQPLVKVGYDDEALYIGAVMLEANPDGIKAELGERDAGVIFNNDDLEIYFDCEGKQERYIQLATNASGVIYDGEGFDYSWNGDWGVATSRGNNFWSAEIRIPFSTLSKAKPTEGTIWRWNVTRYRYAGGKPELSSLNPLIGTFHAPKYFGELVFSKTPLDIQQEEKELNNRFLSVSGIKDRYFELHQRFVKEKEIAIKMLEKSIYDTILFQQKEIDLGMASLAKDIEGSGDIYSLCRALLTIEVLGTKVDSFVYDISINMSGPSALPANLAGGWSRKEGYFYWSGPDAIFVIDGRNGIVAGIWDVKLKRQYITASYDLYSIETLEKTRKIDERTDEAIETSISTDILRFVCQNDELPGVTLIKEYTPKALAGEVRILAKDVTIRGKSKEKTLLSLSSSTLFNRDFRKDALYERVFAIGTVEDTRSIIPAREITTPVMRRAWFMSDEGRSQFASFNPTTGSGLAQYLYLMNGEWTYPQALNQSYWTAYGWEMGWAQCFLNGKDFSAQMRYHLYRGPDTMKYHREYLNLPEYKSVLEEIKVSPVARKIRWQLGGIMPNEGLFNENEGRTFKILSDTPQKMLRSDEFTISLGFPTDQRWPTLPAEDGQELIQLDGKREVIAKTDTIKKIVSLVRKEYPRFEATPYNFLHEIQEDTQTYREHPEFALKDKYGNKIKSGCYPEVPAYLARWSPEFADYMVEKLIRQTDYFGTNCIYLDFTPWIKPDWEHEDVIQIKNSLDFLRKLREELAKRNKFLWLNEFTGEPYCDVGFWEGWEAGNWRDRSLMLIHRKLYNQPGAIIIPLYWKPGKQFPEYEKNDSEYRNIVLALGLTPMWPFITPQDYFGQYPEAQAVCFKWQSAYGSACIEIVDTRFVEIGLSPAYWRDLATDIEAYSLKQGDAFFVSAIGHYPSTRDVELTVDINQMGLERKKRTFLWFFQSRDMNAIPRTPNLPETWDRVMAWTKLSTIPELIEQRLKVNMSALVPESVRISVITQVPAVIYSVEGQQTQFLLPETLDCKIEGNLDENKRLGEFTITGNKPLEVILWWPEDWGEAAVTYKNGKTVEDKQEYIKIATERFVKVTLPAGKFELEMRPR